MGRAQRGTAHLLDPRGERSERVRASKGWKLIRDARASGGVEFVIRFTKGRETLDYPDVRAFSGTAVATADAGHFEREVTKEDARPDFPALFRELSPYVYSVLRGLGVPNADLEDVCQDVFVVVHRKLATYEERGSLHAWLYGICVRASIHARRRRARSPDVGSETLPDAVDPTTPAEQVKAAQGRQILYAILDQLDDDKRAVFVLYELEELTMAEVAKSLDINIFTAYSRLRAARADVQQAIRRFSREGGVR